MVQRALFSVLAVLAAASFLFATAACVPPQAANSSDQKDEAQNGSDGQTTDGISDSAVTAPGANTTAAAGNTTTSLANSTAPAGNTTTPSANSTGVAANSTQPAGSDPGVIDWNFSEDGS